MSSIESNKTNYGAVGILTAVFFFWGFIAAGNGVFIPFCKSYFGLDQFQSQLVDFAFYGAYYLGALGLFVVGSRSGRDLVGTWGYKKSIVYGLIFSAIGAGAMIISVYLNVFSGMLFGLFIVALGFSLQQTSANPFMIALGDESTGSNRINLGGGINSLGTTVGPLIVSLVLFGTTASLSDDMIESLSLSKVIVLYACVGALFLGVAALFGFSKKVPKGISEDKAESAKRAMVTLLVITGLLVACFSPVFSSYLSKDQKKIEAIDDEIADIKKEINATYNAMTTAVPEEKMAEREADQRLIYIEKYEVIDAKTAESSALSEPLEKRRMSWLLGGLAVILFGLLFAYMKGKKEKEGWGAMQYPQLTLGMLAIFVYVGVEVAIGSNLGELLNQDEFGAMQASSVAPYIAMFWGSLMIGRWAGAINAFNLSHTTKMVLRFFVPMIAFSVVLLLSWLAGYDVSPLKWYVVCVGIQIVAFYVTNDKPALTLGVFGVLGVVAIAIGLMSSGTTAIYAFLSGGLACSIMWPCIFSLSLGGLGKYQTQGAGFLVMMILGGAIIPPLQGKLADVMGIQESFVVGIFCFLYLAIFGLIARKILKSQGVHFE